MLQKNEKVLFLDIETVPQHEVGDNLSNLEKELFDLKTKYQRKDENTLEEFYQRAGIWAEFGKIVCISVGYFRNKNETCIRDSFQATYLHTV